MRAYWLFVPCVALIVGAGCRTPRSAEPTPVVAPGLNAQGSSASDRCSFAGRWELRSEPADPGTAPQVVVLHVTSSGEGGVDYQATTDREPHLVLSCATDCASCTLSYQWPSPDPAATDPHIPGPPPLPQYACSRAERRLDCVESRQQRRLSMVKI